MISSLKYVNQLQVIPILINYPHYNLNEKVDHTNKLVDNDYTISLKNRPHKLGILYTLLHRESLKAPRAVRQLNMVMSPVGLGTNIHCAGEGQQQFNGQSVSQSVSQSVTHSTRMV
jgi:hypothetical protein